MGVRVIADENYAALYDSVSMTVLEGPVIGDGEVFANPETAAWAFLNHLGQDDPRDMEAEELRRRWSEFICAIRTATG